MRKACKIILPIALIALIASIALYVVGVGALDKATKTLSETIWNYYMIEKSNMAKYVSMGVLGSTLLLALIRAIAIRKKKSVCLIDFLLILMFNGAAAFSMKDVIKENIQGDIMLLCSVVAYAIHLVLILVCMLISIAGKKHEKSNMQAVIVGPSTYLVTFVLVLGVFGVLFAKYKMDMFAELGSYVKEFINYLFKFKGGWDADHVKTAMIMVVALTVVTFAALATIVRKRNLMPVLYSYIAIILYFVLKVKAEFLNSTLAGLNATDASVLENVCAPIFVVGVGLVILICSVQVFNMIIALIDAKRVPVATAAAKTQPSIISDEEKAEAQAIMQEIEDEEPVEEEAEEPVEDEAEEEIVEDEEPVLEEEPEEEVAEVVEEDEIEEEPAPQPAPQPKPVAKAAAKVEEEDDEEYEDEEFDGEEEDEDEDDFDDWEEEDDEVKAEPVKAEDDELLLDDDEEEDSRDALRRRRDSIRERIMAARNNNENEIVEYAIEDEIVEEEVVDEENDSLESQPAPAPQPRPVAKPAPAPAPVDEDEDEDDEDDEIDEEAYNESIAYDDEDDEDEEYDDEDEEEEEEDDEVERNRAALREKLAQQRQAQAQKEAEPAPAPIVMPVIEEEPQRDFKKIKSKPMKDKMATALDDDKRYRYNMVRNELESYKKVHERMSSKGESFRYHGDLIAKISVAGKSVRLHLALNPDDYQNTKYHFKDLSAKSRYALVPFTVKLSSNRSVKYSLELIQQLAEQFGLKKNPKFSNKDFAKDILNDYKDAHPEEFEEKEPEAVEENLENTPVENVEAPVAEEAVEAPVEQSVEPEQEVEDEPIEQSIEEEPVEEEVVADPEEEKVE